MQLGISASLGATATGALESATLVTNTKSIAFDGTDFINCGDIELDGLSGLTVSAWFKANSTGASSRIVSKDQVGVQGCFNLWIDSSNNLEFLAHNGSGWKTASYDSFSEDTNWHHVVGVFSATEIKLYLDKAEVANDTYTSTTLDDSDNEEIVIGADSDVASTDQHFTGNIDEVAIWNSALTTTEIEAIYDNIRLDFTKDSAGYASSSNLKGWWRMGDEADTRVLDTDANNLIVPDMRKTFFTGKSIDFDNSDDYIAANGVASTITDFPFTMSAWANLESSGSGETIVSFSDVSDTDVIFQFSITSGADKIQLLARQNGGSSKSITASSATTPGVWVHIVGVFASATSRKLYINGAQEGSEDTNSVAFDSDDIDTFTIGGLLRSNVTRHFGGKITDVAIWNAELNADTITSIYNSGEPNDLQLSASYTAGSGVDKTSNLQGYWRMGNGTLDEHPLVADQTNLTLATSIVQNGDFEDTIAITSSGFPNHNYVDYTSDSAQDLTISTDTSNPRNGSKCMKLTLTGETSGEVNYKIEDIPAGLYKISIFARNGVSQNSAKIRLGGHTLLRSFATADSGSIDLTDSYQEIVAYLSLASTTTIFFAIGVTNGTDGHHILVDDFSVQKFNGNAGIMTSMSQYDIVEHAPNRHSGDMIGFDATSDIENDVKT